MKKLSLTALLMFFGVVMFAQAPEQINYQAVVRDASGNSVTNTAVGVRIAILQGSTSGPEIFAETHGPTTNGYGLITLQIGTGSPELSTLDAIDWGVDTYFIQIEIDPTGGTSYTVTSVSQLVSVPYALYAKDVENKDDADADPTNEYNTTAVMNADTLEITDGGGTLQVDLSALGDDADSDPNNEIQMLNKVGQVVTLSLGGGAFTDDVDDADNNPANEFNTGVTLVGTTLQITDGGGIVSADLSTLQDGVNDADSDPTNEYNTGASLIGTTLQVTDAGGNVTVDLSSLQDGVNDADADPTNEYNTSVTLVGTDLNVTDGGGTITTDLSSLQDGVNDADADPTNEYNTSANLTGTDLNIIDGGGTITVDMSPLVGGGDPSSTNELNTAFFLDGDTIKITDAGGTMGVDLSGLGGGGGGPQYYVGQQAFGGIIIFVDSTGIHGLVAAMVDVGTDVVFENGANSATPVATSMIDGAGNTALLAPHANDYTAAQLCDAYAGGGFTDWYLPALFELEILMRSNYILELQGAGLEYAAWYWSSTETPVIALNAHKANTQTHAAQEDSQTANGNINVRPIRAF